MVKLEQLNKRLTIFERIESIKNEKSHFFECMEESQLEKYSYDWFLDFFNKKGYSNEKSKTLALKFCKKD